MGDTTVGEVLDLPCGLYDKLVTLALQRGLEDPELESRCVPLSPDTASEALAPTQGLLVPFQYFGVDDQTDLSQLDFRAGRYSCRRRDCRRRDCRPRPPHRRRPALRRPDPRRLHRARVPRRPLSVFAVDDQVVVAGRTLPAAHRVVIALAEQLDLDAARGE